MSPEKAGSLIGAGFGLVFVLVNAGSLPAPMAVLVRLLGSAAFLVVLAATGRRGESSRPARSGSGRGYGLVVVAEALALGVGLALLNGPLETPHAAVAWVSFVVGLHFFALAVVWADPLFHALGAALLACGSVGLALAVGGVHASTIDVAGGVLPGCVLLAFGLWSSLRSRTSAG